MNAPKEKSKRIVEHALPSLVLAILLIYTYAKLFKHYYGFSWDPNGRIDGVYSQQAEPTLATGDRLVRVGQVGWPEFHEDLSTTFFDGVQVGEIVPVDIERGGQFLTIPWRLPGVSYGEIADQFLSEWPLSFAFWLAGTLTMLYLRPKDRRYWLLAAFSFVTAIWLGTGGGASNYHIWYSAIILRMVIWLSIPIYLHLHWVFPHPLRMLPRPLVGIIYALGLALAIAQGFQLLPQSLYLIGFLLAILGSLILLLAHALLQPETRRDLRLLGVAVVLALAPLLTIAVVNSINGFARASGLVLLSFPVLPFAYLYSAYRRQLGELEVRINRLSSVYFFLILLGVIGIPLLAVADRLLASSPDDILIIGALSTLSVTVLSIWAFPVFQRFVERRWLGISLPIERLPEIYSARISTSNSFPALEKLLRDEVLPSILIQQFVFLLASEPHKIILAIGVEQRQIEEIGSIQEVASLAGKYRPIEAQESSQRHAWIRLVLPLKVGGEWIALWLLGSRDPDDSYSQAEIALLESLANQTAIATSNILQAEQLRAIYQADINRHEQERINLARDLHDSILNQLAALLMNLDPASRTSKFQDAYEELTQRLREIVTDLRPPMLHYGLKPAIMELADTLMERTEDKVKFVVDLQSDDSRYPSLTELHLFRIIQEACENALRHGQAQTIKITGRLNAQQIELNLEDDGLGFEVGDGFELSTLLAHRHFGLLGMAERAELIGAEIHIDSAPKVGTRIRITWKPTPA